MTEESDLQTLRLLRSGSEAAFEKLMLKYDRIAYKIIWPYLRQNTEVQDAVQEVFLTLWRKRRSVKAHNESPLPWVIVASKNTALNAARRQKKHWHSDISVTIENTGIEQHQMIHEFDWLKSELPRLSLGEQELLESLITHGPDYAELSKIHGTNAAAMRQRVHRVRTKLRTAREKGAAL